MIDPSLGHGCLIQAASEDGPLVGIGFDRNRDAGHVTAVNEAWGDIEEGAACSILLDLDGEKHQVEPCGSDLNGVPGADISFDNVDALCDIARKHTMTPYTGERRVVDIDPEGTSSGLQAAVGCQEAMDGDQDRYGPQSGSPGG